MKTSRAVVEKWEHKHFDLETLACKLATYILIGFYQWYLNMWGLGKTHPGGNFQLPKPLHDELPRERAPVDEGGAVRFSLCVGGCHV